MVGRGAACSTRSSRSAVAVPSGTKLFSSISAGSGDGDALEERIARELGEFLRENISFFQSYDRVIVYYDRGQKEISRTLRVAFAASLSHVEHRVVAPADYVLFQVADLCCTIELVERRRTERGLTKSEAAFFGGAGSFKKTYLKEFRRWAF